jgi:hypothetical protein
MIKKYIRNMKKISGISIFISNNNICLYNKTYCIDKLYLYQKLFNIEYFSVYDFDRFELNNVLYLDFENYFIKDEYDIYACNFFDDRIIIDNYIAILVNNILFDSYIDGKIYLKKNFFEFIIKKYHKNEIKLMANEYAKKLYNEKCRYLEYKLFKKIVFKKIKYFLKKMNKYYFF